MIVFINCYEEMATGMRLLAAMAREKGHDVHIIVVRGYAVKITGEIDDGNASMHVLVNGELHVNPLRTRNFTPAELNLLRDRLRELEPEMVCVSTRSANDAIIPDILSAAKESAPNAPLVCGGYGPTYDPAHYLRNGANLVLRGEGEISFIALLDNLENGAPLTDTPNACYFENGDVKCNPMAEPIKNICDLPSPLVGDSFVSYITEDENGVSVIRGHDPAYDNSTFCILVGRGCIGKCSYCAAPVQKEMYAEEGHILPSYRRRNYAQVFEELEAAKANGIKNIFFKDEYLVDETSRLTAFFREYKTRIDLPFKANLHFGQLLKSPALLDAVLDAGIQDLTLGFQAGTEQMAKNVYGRPHDFADLKTLANILYNEHVPVQYHFVSGTTLNTEEEFAAKCALIASLPYDALLPWRTMLFDFQFFPQPKSLMTREIGAGALKRLPAREWASQALRAQLWHFATPEEAMEAQDMAAQCPDKIEFLLKKSEQLRKKAWFDAFGELVDELAGKNIIVMGEATPDFVNLSPHFLKAGTKIIAHAGFPGYKLDHGRIDPKNIVTDYGPDVPLVFFGTAAYRFMSKMKRGLAIKNPMHGLAEFTERF